MSSAETASNTTAPTRYVTAGDNTYAYRSHSANICPMPNSSSTPTLVMERCFNTRAHLPVMFPSSSIAVMRVRMGTINS